MIAEFNIHPTDSTHLSRDMARVIEVLRSTDLKYRLGPMGTCVEGELEPVLAAIRRCHQAVADRHERVVTTITIDDRKTRPHHLDEMISSVEQALNRVPRSDMDPEC
jgi:uncharacterized protein (TIGR00106 family)